MITLPAAPAPRSIEPALIDFGSVLKPPTGGKADRLNRKGNRYRALVSIPPMVAADARIFIARLLRAKTEGLRIALPLLVPQGSPGAPVVNGAGQAGTTLNVRGLTAGYVAAEGYWLSVVDASGQHYLHNLGASSTASGGGTAALTITPELRVPFADGATIHLAAPMIEGLVQGEEWGWTLLADRLVPLEFALEETA